MTHSIFHPDLEAPANAEDLRKDDIIAIVTYLDGVFNTWSQYRIFDDSPKARKALQAKFDETYNSRTTREIRWLVKAPRLVLEPGTWGFATLEDGTHGGTLAKGFVDEVGIFLGHTIPGQESVKWEARQLKQWEPLEVIHPGDKEEPTPPKTEDLFPDQDPEPPRDHEIIDCDGDAWNVREDGEWAYYGSEDTSYHGTWMDGTRMADYAPFKIGRKL